MIHSIAPKIRFVISILLAAVLSPGQIQAAELSLSYPASIANLAPNQHAKLNETVYRNLESAQTLAEKDNTKAALGVLEELLQKYPQNPYIVSLALRSAAYLLIGAEQIDDSIPLINLIIKLDSLDKDALLSLQHLLPQLYYQNEDYPQSIKALEHWIKNVAATQINREDYYLMAIAWYQLSNCEKVITSSGKGLAIKAQTKTDETFLQLQLNCQLQTENYRDADLTLTKLLTLAPTNDTYWSQWSAVLLRMNQSEKALSALELMQAQKLMPGESQRLQYVRLLAQQKNYERAARLLTEYVSQKQVSRTADTPLFIAQLWEQAGEVDKAIATLETANREMTGSSNQKETIFRRLVNLLSLKNDWQKLIELIETHYGPSPANWKVGQLSQADESLLLQCGFAYHQLGQTEHAQTVFLQLQQAPTLSTASKQIVEQWLTYLDTAR